MKLYEIFNQEHVLLETVSDAWVIYVWDDENDWENIVDLGVKTIREMKESDDECLRCRAEAIEREESELDENEEVHIYSATIISSIGLPPEDAIIYVPDSWY